MCRLVNQEKLGALEGEVPTPVVFERLSHHGEASNIFDAWRLRRHSRIAIYTIVALAHSYMLETAVLENTQSDQMYANLNGEKVVQNATEAVN